MEAERVEIIAEREGRLDVILSENTDMTRSRILKLIKSGMVRVNGLVSEKAGLAVKAGEVVAVDIPPAIPAKAVAQDIDIDVVYQDSDLAVVFKPSGMVAHPGAGNPDGTLVNALLNKLDHLSGIGGELRPGLVHRIDKDTSGLLLVAKNDMAHVNLSAQIAEHSVERAYLAITRGWLKQDFGFVDAPIGRHPTDRKKMAIVKTGRTAHTNYRVLESLNKAQLVECALTTGRTHQIRVHMASIGHPVMGDPVYGMKNDREIEGGQLLHAYKIGFTHPTTGERMLFKIKPEERFDFWYRKLGGTDSLDKWIFA